MKNKFYFVLSLSFMMACSDRPSREKFPGPPGQTTEFQSAEARQAVMGGGNSMSAPVASGGRESAPSAPDSGETLEGSIALGRGVKPLGTFLFLSVRPAEGGPPLAARKIENPEFPMKFSLSSSDVMMPGTPFTGDVVVTARLKQDSNPLSRVKGDLSAQKPTKVGDHKINLILDQVE